MNTLQCARYVYRSEGIRGFYRGLTASYAGISETIICFAVYERLKQLLKDPALSPFTGNPEKHSTNFLGITVAAAISKGCASCIAYPHGKGSFVFFTQIYQPPPAWQNITQEKPGFEEFASACCENPKFLVLIVPSAPCSGNSSQQRSFARENGTTAYFPAERQRAGGKLNRAECGRVKCASVAKNSACPVLINSRAAEVKRIWLKTLLYSNFARCLTRLDKFLDLFWVWNLVFPPPPPSKFGIATVGDFH